jgi:hypothetical protein
MPKLHLKLPLNIPVSYKHAFKQQTAAKAKADNITPVYITKLKNKSYKPNSYKHIFKQQTSKNAKSNNVLPTYVSGIRQKYEKSGKLSNAHKKYLNILGIPRVVKQGCSSCGKALDPL